ncbi:MAG: hypothetical protein EXS46_03700 [Candidatus Taylorbacteria bacterium]|nr:hypothetical protein [Candidatus Taylorbacteria bacterium]
MTNKNSLYLGIAVVIGIIAIVSVKFDFFMTQEGDQTSTESEVSTSEDADVSQPASGSGTEVKSTLSDKPADVASKRAEIIARVQTGKLLSQKEKAEIADIMLHKAQFYMFTDAETKMIFKLYNQ